ncbi:hypothetical protein H6G06_14305 [Anabaena sphaerica FACHB-251]|uniref:WD40 repeat-containing protein n=1 Tax=Anabaena sphaerica FACHB-251 TaxID=2692883 RepID=A0A927A1H2_9NOST|nr:hypothetical protein [Anabaena sphaerica]MBD2294619.1 hypothetical protein [Anabaena sphaerica FACHB-251]
MGALATKLAAKSAEFKNFFLGQFPEQQLKAGNSEKYYQTLIDFDFISLKIQSPNFGIEALIKDYDLITNPEIFDNLEEDEKLETEQIKTLKLIQNALQLSNHILNQDPNQLVGQLWGRLQSFQNSDVQKILQDAAESKSEIPRFRPITASLTNPGGSLLRTLPGHNKDITVIAMTPDGKKAVSGSDDATLKLWDLETGIEISTLTFPTSYKVDSIVITSDGKKALCSNYQALIMLDIETGKEISMLTNLDSTFYDYLDSVSITPDYKKVLCCFRKMLKILDVVTATEISIPNENIEIAAINPDGKKILSFHTWLHESGYVLDGIVKLWDLETGKDIFTLNEYKAIRGMSSDKISGKLVISSDGKKGYFYFPKLLNVWDLETGKEISDLTDDQELNTVNVSQEISKFTSDKELLKTVETAKVVAINYNNKKAITSSGETLKVWNLLTEIQISIPSKNHAQIKLVDINSDGKKAISSCGKTLKVWDLQTGTEISTLTIDNIQLEQSYYDRDKLNLIALTPDWQKVLSIDNENVKIWNLETGKEISSFAIYHNIDINNDCKLNVIALTPNWKKAIVAYNYRWDTGVDTSLKLWDLETGIETSTNLYKQEMNLPSYYYQTSDKKSHILLWDLEAKREISCLIDTKWFNAMKITPDGKKVLSSSDENTLKLLDLDTGKEISSFIADSPIICCAISPDGLKIVAGEESGRVHFLQLEFLDMLKEVE